MIVRVTHVCDLEFGDQHDMLDITASAIAIMQGSSKKNDRIRSERASIELIYREGTPVTYAGASVVGATTDGLA